MSAQDSTEVIKRIDKLDVHISDLFEKGRERDRLIANNLALATKNSTAIKDAAERWEKSAQWTPADKDKVMAMIDLLPNTIRSVMQEENEKAAIFADAARYRAMRKLIIGIVVGTVGSGAVIIPAITWVIQRFM